MVILMVNGICDLLDVLWWWCFYVYLDYFDCDIELLILWVCYFDIEFKLVVQIVGVVQVLCKEDLIKVFGIVEMFDWVVVLLGFGVNDLL